MTCVSPGAPARGRRAWHCIEAAWWVALAPQPTPAAAAERLRRHHEAPDHRPIELWQLGRSLLAGGGRQTCCVRSY